MIYLRRGELVQVTGDSLLIHAFAYSLFIGICCETVARDLNYWSLNINLSVISCVSYLKKDCLA